MPGTHALAGRRGTSALRGPATSWVFFFNDTATTEIYTLSLHDALPIYARAGHDLEVTAHDAVELHRLRIRSEEHTSELQSPDHLVCRLLLEKKKDVHHLCPTLQHDRL